MDMPSAQAAGYGAAFLVGLFGGVHCVGMCGGIVGALSLGLDPQRRRSPWRALPLLLAYNVGRIASYTAAGALVGGLGWYAAHLAGIRHAQMIFALAAALFMVALGLYLAGWWQGLARIERLGAALWRCIEPLGRSLLPVRNSGQALRLGALWGWLPCGLVYSVLVWALASGGVLHGALLMLAFGLGTLPNLLAMGVFAARLATFTRKPWVRVAAGLVVAGFGVLSLARVGGKLLM